MEEAINKIAINMTMEELTEIIRKEAQIFKRNHWNHTVIWARENMRKLFPYTDPVTSKPEKEMSPKEKALKRKEEKVKKWFVKKFEEEFK